MFPVAFDLPRVSGRVAVRQVALHDFRCHRRLKLALHPGAVVLVGANGSGKTSVLEALSLLTPGRGLLRSRLADMRRRQPPENVASAWSVSARLEVPGGPMDIVTAFEAGDAGRDRRHVSIDGQPARGRAALAVAFGALWLTPEMDRLFTEAPSARRRFLDRLVWGIDPAHVARVSAYQRAMQQRSALLRQPAADAAWLSALEETMAGLAIAVAVARRQAAEALSQLALASLGWLPRILVGVSGTVEQWLDEVPALEGEERLRGALLRARAVDAETGGAAVGPHRSDLIVVHGESGRRAQDCSTGEQKMLLIATVLAAAELQKRERGAAPLLLLDDVVAHLDARHREAVFASIDDLAAQAWYAGCDRAAFAPLEGRAQFVTLGGAPGGAGGMTEDETAEASEQRGSDE